MNWKSKVIPFFLVLTLAACGSPKDEQKLESPAIVQNYASNKYLIEAEDLNQKIGKDDFLKIIDVRKPEEFNQGHIPGALNVWRQAIQSKDFEYSGMMASGREMEALLGSLGIEPQHHIVMYDSKGDVDAARLWWILYRYGHDKMALLNGGLVNWKIKNYPITREVDSPDPVVYIFPDRERSDRLAMIEDVKAALGKDNWLVVDTRTPEEFSGMVQKKGASRAGRIPKSLFLEWSNTINFGQDFKFRSREELNEMVDSLGISSDRSIITYCHSGVRSAHFTFVLTELLGYKQVYNYDGSWTEWSYFEELPLEKDSGTIESK